MAQFKAKLTTAGFPFNFEELAGTVLIGSALDQNLRDGAEQEIPQAYFMQNTLPTQRGFTSVHYTRVIGEHTYPKYLDKIFVLYDIDGNVALYSTAYGQRYVYNKDTGAWTSFPVPDGMPIGDTTVAYLKGTTYILISSVGLFYYNFQEQTLEEVTLIGDDVNVTALRGITAASSYLVGWDSNTVYWSDPLNPLLFTPSRGSAGSSAILGNRSRILQCLPMADGFIAYTTRSAIACSVTQNPNFPFSFREIAGSAGVESNEHVAYDAPSDRHIAWTTSGFQAISAKGAQLIWPELSDSIANGLFSQSTSLSYPYIVSSDKLDIKVSNIGARYIAVSVRKSKAIPYYSHAYIYDIALERWGRLDIPHIDFFEYRAPEFVASLTWEQLTTTWETETRTWEQLVQEVTTKTPQFGTTFGCVSANGAVYVALSSSAYNIDGLESVSSGAATPCIYIGRYRLQRPTAVQVQQVQLSLLNASDCSLQFIAHDSSGKSVRTVVPVNSLRMPSQYWARLTGAHISFRISGKYNLTSLESELIAMGNSNLPSAPARPLTANAVTVGAIPVYVSGELVVNG